MKDTIKAGMSAAQRIEVDTPRTIDFLGENLRVYATPELVRDFEIACREFLLAHTDAGEDSVGTGISVTHGGATLRGMSVDIVVTVNIIKNHIFLTSVQNAKIHTLGFEITNSISSTD